MKTVLCFGDSNTYGYNPKNRRRYTKMQRWPGILAAFLGSGYNILEEGLNGRTTDLDDPYEEGRSGLDYILHWLPTAPDVDIALIMLGSNDLKSCFDRDAAKIARSAGKVAEMIRNHFLGRGIDTKIILISPPLLGEDIKSSPFYPDFDENPLARSKRFADEYYRVADEFGFIFFDAADMTIPCELDKVHLMPDSHQALAAALTDLINKLQE